MDIKDVLSFEDWAELREIASILGPFHTVTKRLEGNAVNGSHGSLWEVLPCMEYIFEHLTKVRNDLISQEQPPFILQGVRLALAKLEEYWKMIDDTPVVIAAFVMNPTYKWTYLRRKWTGAKEKKWLEKAYKEVQDIRDTYKLQAISKSAVTLAQSTTTNYDAIDSFLRPPPSEIEADDASSRDEYERYCALPPIETDNIFKWWIDNSKEYPQLSQMAQDLLSIPAMSTECERVFSGGEDLIRDKRNRIGEDSVEANECLRAWFRAGLFKRWLEMI